MFAFEDCRYRICCTYLFYMHRASDQRQGQCYITRLQYMYMAKATLCIFVVVQFYYEMKIVLASIVLIEMILYVPVNRYGHIGTLPPFYGYGTSVHPETASNLTILVNH